MRNAIDLKAKNIADIHWKLFSVAKDGTREEVTMHPLLDLLAAPNPAQTKEAFWQQAIIFGDLKDPRAIQGDVLKIMEINS